MGVVKHGAMGGGDVKLALALGGATAVAAGVPGTLLAMVIAGLLTGIAGMLVRERGFRMGHRCWSRARGSCSGTYGVMGVTNMR